MNRKPSVFMLVVGYTSFLILGAFDGQLGVAWPSMRNTFGLSLDAVGMLLIAGTVGFSLASILSGGLIARWGAGVFLLGASLLGLTGTMGMALSPKWWGAVIAYLLVGLGSGCIEVGMNTLMAVHCGAREMNWLHGFYGIGSTVGPLIVTGLLGLGIVWRWGYGVIALMYLLLAAYFVLTLRRWQGIVTHSEGTGEGRSISGWGILRLPVVWFGVVLFFTYTGVEATAGQWSFTLLTEGRAIPETTAGVWVSLLWGSFTIARLVLGALANRMAPIHVVRVSLLGAILGAALLWWNPTDAFSLLGLIVLGVSFASIYPGMMTLTPEFVGQKHAASAIGFQTGAAGLGAAGLPVLAGVLADGVGLEIIAPFMLASLVLTLVLQEVTVAHGTRDQAAAVHASSN